MIIRTKAELGIARIFCNRPFHYFSISELVENTGISRTWIYKVLDNLKFFHMIVEEGRRYKFDFSNIVCRRLKLFFDSEFIFSSRLRAKVIEIVERIIYEDKPISIILLGSVAVGENREISDIDFLVISSRREIPQVKENVNIIIMDKEEFEKKYLEGDDFIISALSYGKIIYDKEYFIRFYEKPLPIFSSEVIQSKIDYCRRLRDRVYALLRSDIVSAREELMNLLMQCARIILLRNRIIPSSKHEILHLIGRYDRDLAEVLDKVLKKREVEKEEIVKYLDICNKII